MRKRVELLTRPGCCLCQTARAALLQVRAEQPFDLVEIDIDAPAAAAYRLLYGHEIPVVRVGGEVLARLRLDDPALARLRQALGQDDRGGRSPAVDDDGRGARAAGGGA